MLDATCVGVDLEMGVRLEAPPGRRLAVVLAVLHLTACLRLSPRLSPQQFHQLLGILQWYDLLRRPKLSVYWHVYDFVRDREETRVRLVPPDVVDELLVSILLATYWLSDLTRPYCPLVAAADASTEFGFGASVLKTSEAQT